MALEPIKLGWKALGAWLNKLVAVVNLQTPIGGHGITCEPSESGTIISWVPPDTITADPAAAPGSTTQVNASTGGGGTSTAPNLDDLTARVAVLEAILSGNPAWSNVDVMDGGCNRSTIHVLTRP